MQVDRELVVHIAKLSRLSLSEDLIDHYRQQMAKIVSYVEQINEIEDTLGDSWRPDTIGEPSPLRHDEQTSSEVSSLVLDQSPDRLGTSFQVPRIID